MSKHLAPKPYVTVESRKNGVVAIKLLCEPYSGIIVSYGRIKFDEVDDKCVMHFDYEVHESPVEYNVDELKQYLGDLLVAMMVEQLAENNIHYTGGVDEHRTTDSN